MQSDLHNLTTAEESYFYDHATYTAALDSLHYNTSPGDVGGRHRGHVSGWSATSTNPRVVPALLRAVHRDGGAGGAGDRAGSRRLPVAQRRAAMSSAPPPPFREFTKRRDGMIYAMDGGLWLHRHLWKGRRLAHLVSTNKALLLAYGAAVGLPGATAAVQATQGSANGCAARRVALGPRRSGAAAATPRIFD